MASGMSLSVSEGGSAHHVFTLALCGPRALCDPLITRLREDPHLGDAGIAYRHEPAEFLHLVAHRHDVAAALLFWPDADVDGLLRMVEAVRARQADPLMALLVRGTAPLSAAQRSQLHDSAIHGFSYCAGTDEERVVDDIARALHQKYEKQALVELAEFGGTGAATESLTELAAAALHFLHRHGIGGQGGLFLLRRSITLPAWVTLGGTGQFGAVDCTTVTALDIPQRTAIIAGLEAEGDAPDAPGLWLRVTSSDGTQGCIYLLQNEALKPWHRVVVQVFRQRLAVAMGEVLLKRRMARMHQATITTLATLAEYRDVDTASHVSRVARLTTGVAMLLADAGVVTAADMPLVRHIGQASVLHDVGKVGIPDRVLLKRGLLDEEERAVINHHAVMGQEILLKAARISDNPDLLLFAADIARSHHEKFDGSGYPDGLAGEAIPLAARIVAVVDVFDALTGERPYKAPWPEEKAVDFICAQAGKHFDPQVVEVFLAALEQMHQGQVAAWSDDFSVGHAEIDQDHQTLFGILNQIGTAALHGNRHVIEMALDDLIHYTLVHFQREEAYMRTIAYPDYAAHRAAHDTFTQHIEVLRWDYCYGVCNDISAHLLSFLGDWLANHIGQADRMYQHFLAGQGARITG